MSVESNSALPGTTEEPMTVLAMESEEIQALMRRTGYPLKQENGQRRYGPPPDWNCPPPGRGCEVFIGKLPRDCFENELVPIFEQFGRIYEVGHIRSSLFIRYIRHFLCVYKICIVALGFRLE